MKVFFRHRDSDGSKLGDSLSKADLHTEELGLTERLEQELWNQLQSSHELLPSCVGIFQDWKTALLDRFTESDLQP